ncbi:MAG: hypothetical protein EBS49_04860 [Verrucomicrobia bacterium]|nr:hypothetical protein [Verrucomicrobiota bacterium]
MYQRNVKIYKGIDNVIEIEVKNHDQKRIEIGNDLLKLVLMDQSRNLIGTYTAENMEDSTQVGLARITIPTSDLDDLDPQFLKFAVLKDQMMGPEVLTYTDSQYGAVGTMQLLNGLNYITTSTKVYDRFTQETNYTAGRWEDRKTYYNSEGISLNDYRAKKITEVKLKIKMTNFYGTVKVEGTKTEVIGNESFRNPAILLNFTWDGYNGIWTTDPLPIDDLNYLRVRYIKTAGSLDSVSLLV